MKEIKDKRNMATDYSHTSRIQSNINITQQYAYTLHTATHPHTHTLTHTQSHTHSLTHTHTRLRVIRNERNTHKCQNKNTLLLQYVQ